VLVELVNQVVGVPINRHSNRLGSKLATFERAEAQPTHDRVDVIVVHSTVVAVKLIPDKVMDLPEPCMFLHAKHPLAGKVTSHNPGGPPILPKLT
jgi:hypothetical protein